MFTPNVSVNDPLELVCISAGTQCNQTQHNSRRIFHWTHARLRKSINWQRSLAPASEGWRKVMFSLCPPFRGGGGTPSQVCGGGVSQPGLNGGGYPSQVWMVGYPLGQVWMVGVYPGYPPPWLDGVPPLHQHSKHLLRSGRYASCVHAGGLSC